MFDRSIAGASRSRQATLSLGAAAAAAIFIQSASADVTLSNWSPAGATSPSSGAFAGMAHAVAVKFTTGAGSAWALTSFKARTSGSGMAANIQIWTDGSTTSDPKGAGATMVANSAFTTPMNNSYGWATNVSAANYASNTVLLAGGTSYWAVVEIGNSGDWGNAWSSPLQQQTNGSGWSLGETRALRQYGPSGWTTGWSTLVGQTGTPPNFSWLPITPEIEFNATAVAPAPGALALLGVAGLARRRRRER